jgi:transcriptional regulator with XRE-family HTH domain
VSENSDNELARLGARIRAYRTMRKMSLRSLAEASAASPSFISQLELGRTNASLGMLRRIAGALNLTMADMFDEDGDSGLRVIRREKRPELPAGPGILKYLISQRPLRNVEVCSTELDVDAATGSIPYTHGDSQELVLVLRGRVTLLLGEPGGEVAYGLETGDSTEFRSSVPHLIANAGETTAEVLFVIAPPSPM